MQQPVRSHRTAPRSTVVQRIILFLAVTIVGVGCTSRAMRVAPPPPASYRVLGTVRGGACGMMLFDLIPINVNQRIEHAYAQALAKARGATSLMDTQIRDRWYTAGGLLIAGHIVCTDIVATAIMATDRPQ